jgi:uncharacterized membrane protein YcaP (DUF421 family)
VWHDIFHLQVPVAEKVLRTVLIYALIAMLLRATGKRELAGLNSLDIVVMVLLSNVVQNGIIGNDNSVTGAAVGAVTLVAVNSALNWAAQRSDKVALAFDGTDTTIIEGGRILERAARHVGLRRGELDHAVRLQNGDDIAQVEHGVLDPGGQLVLTLKPLEQGATKGDVELLAASLARIEQLLAGGSGARFTRTSE